MRAYKIGIAIPSGDEFKAETALALAEITSFTTSLGHKVPVMNSARTTVSDARNQLVEGALEMGLDYLFWLDSDMDAPSNVIKRLLAHEQPIVGCRYAQRRPPFKPVGSLVDDAATTGLKEAVLLGGGCMLIATEVYRRMSYPWYYDAYRYREDDAKQAFSAKLADQWLVALPEGALDHIFADPRMRQWLEETQLREARFGVGGYVSEDVTFCYKARRFGFKVFADLDLSYEIAHIGTRAFGLRRPS